MTDYSQKSIILVPFPFSDQSTSKKRPAVIISSDEYNSNHYDLVVMAITSKIEKNDKYILKDWEESGLLKESALKPVFFTIEKSLIIRQLGELTDNDFFVVKKCLNDILNIN